LKRPTNEERQRVRILVRAIGRTTAWLIGV
jgi:hypothetical protein